MDPLERYVDAAAAAIGLEIAAAHRPGVLTYMRLAAGLAQQVMDFPLSPADESASVFRPASPSTEEVTR